MPTQNMQDTYKLNDFFLLQKIAGTPYLLPFGQSIVDYRHGIRLNETSYQLLTALRQPVTAETLCSILAAFYDARPDEYLAIQKDVQDFLMQMETQNVIRAISSDNAAKPETYDFCIGALTLRMQIPKNYLEPSFWDFSASFTTIPDMLLRYIPRQPSAHEDGDLLIQTGELKIFRLQNTYCLQFEPSYGILEIQVSEDGSWADFYCPLPHPELFRENLFHAIRFAYLIRAQKAGLFAIHSASIAYKQKAWLFSAPSGTGKSTHAALWKKLFDVSDINGDLNLLGFQKGEPVVYGMPWCGTSGIYSTKTYPLGGVIFLKQALTDTVAILENDPSILSIADRLISPTWTKEQFLTNLSFATQLAPSIDTFSLHCTKEDSAAYLMKEKIDKKEGYL